MPPTTDWNEVIADDEAARFERHAAVIAAIQKRSARTGPLARGLHAKGNIGAIAELEIPANLPAELRVGLFATPATYRALVRFSNGSYHRQSDRKPDIRGFAVKLFGVPGKKVIPGLEDETTQDFLAIRTPSVPMKDADEFIAIVRASTTPALTPLRLLGSLGLRRGFAVIKKALAGFKLPQRPLAATSYYTVLPSTYGPFAAQFAFIARDAGEPAKVERADQLGEQLAERLRAQPVIYDLRVRFYTDPVATPIEDASVEWSGEWHTVATLTLPVQDVGSPRGAKVTELVEKLAFDPWHARTDLRPLGNIMRARNVAYRTSTQARGAPPEPRDWPSFEA